jgi:hypothetical protein
MEFVAITTKAARIGIRAVAKNARNAVSNNFQRLRI